MFLRRASTPLLRASRRMSSGNAVFFTFFFLALASGYAFSSNPSLSSSFSSSLSTKSFPTILSRSLSNSRNFFSTSLYSHCSSSCDCSSNSSASYTSSKLPSSVVLPTNEEEKILYLLGMNIGRQIPGHVKGFINSNNINAFTNGFSDALLDKISIKEQDELIDANTPLLSNFIKKKVDEATEEEKKKGAEFLANYQAANPDATLLSEGLLIHHHQIGTGKQCEADSSVRVHYTGRLINQEVFDSSRNHEPVNGISFPLNKVIQGWQIGMVQMKEGGKATMIIPSSIAYGDNGSPPVIPRGATLIFDIELLEVQ